MCEWSEKKKNVATATVRKPNHNYKSLVFSPATCYGRYIIERKTYVHIVSIDSREFQCDTHEKKKLFIAGSDRNHFEPFHIGG